MNQTIETILWAVGVIAIVAVVVGIITAAINAGAAEISLIGG